MEKRSGWRRQNPASDSFRRRCHAAPCSRREPVAEDVRPRREDLTVDAGARHPGDPLGRLLDELGEERPHVEPVGEAELLAAGLGLDHRDPETRALGLEPPHDLRGARSARGRRRPWCRSLLTVFQLRLRAAPGRAPCRRSAPTALGDERQLADDDAQRGQGGRDRIRGGGAGGDDAALARALGAERVQPRRRFLERDGVDAGEGRRLVGIA